MSSFVDWIGAQGDDPKPANSRAERPVQSNPNEPAAEVPEDREWENLPPFDFPSRLDGVEAEWEEGPLDRNPDLWLYRERTVGLLRRYMKLSLETGRLPSLIGREFFRAKVTFYRASTFEDRVIFVRDMEVCLSRLAYFDQQIIARVVLQEHPHERAARILQCSRRTLQRRVPEVIDILSEDFLRVGLLTAIPPKKETP